MSAPKTFNIEIQDDTLIVVLLRDVSSLDEENIRPEFAVLLERLEQSGPNNVVVDFESVSYFGTTMLEALHSIWRRVRKRGGRMALCSLSAMGREVLHVAGFHALWPICASREEALDAVHA